MSRRWNSHEDVKLNHLVRQQKNWKDIVKHFPGRNEKEIRARYLHRFTTRLQKIWTPDEDQKLVNHYYKFGFSKWMMVARQLSRSVRECKDRWVRFIGPQMEDNGVQAQLWSEEEDCEILRLFQLYGPKWGLMSNQLRNRSPNEIRCRWETRLRRRHKYSQSTGKSGFGIRVTVVRKQQKQQQQQQLLQQQTEPPGPPELLVPKQEMTDHRSALLSPLQAKNELPDLPLNDLESEFSSIMNQPIPDGEELKDLSGMDVDIADILGFPLEDTDDLLLENSLLQSAIAMDEASPPPISKPSQVDDAGARSRLTLPLDDRSTNIPAASPSRRKRKRKQFTSSRYSASSSPSPTTPECWTGFINSNNDKPPDVDDREAFIKRFKLEVERDFTELQLKGSSRTDDGLMDDDPFSDDKENAPVASGNGLIDSVKEQYDVSRLVSPMKSTTPVEFSSNSVLDLATEVENSSPPAKRRAVGSRFSRRHSYAVPGEDRSLTSRRPVNRPGRYMPSASRFGVRRNRSNSGGFSSSKSSDSVNRAILERYNPARFAFRRVLQIGHDRSWRHVALGSSRAQTVMTSQAHAFLRRHNYVI